MKRQPMRIALVLGIAMGSPLDAQTLDWGSQVFSYLYNSEGETLDNTFVFEIGAFVDGFVPDESNVGSWFENWRVFDQADYNEGIGYFTSTVHMLDDGTSDSPFLTADSPGFAGLSGYLWVRNEDDPGAGTEWLLTRSESWVFPTPTPGCCDNELNLQWSVSDLDGDDVPVWGSQGGVSGAGAYTTTGPYTLQTFTFVPEPAAATMALLGMSCLSLFRRRN